ncbi:MAG: diguanylate cyclase [Zoogloea sp.]|nr:diguanylate cyclase [Zoogloea sp.]
MRDASSSSRSEEAEVSKAAEDARHYYLRGHLFGPIRLTLLAALVSVVAMIVVWHELQERNNAKLVESLRSEGSEITVKINERFRGYRQVLRGARGLFAASHEVTREEWSSFAEGLDLPGDFPGIQGIGFALRLEPDELAAHVAAMRRQGFPHYRVWPQGQRRMYSAIVFLEPFDWRNQRAFGFDMYSDPARREAMERAWKTNSSALSARVTLVQEAGPAPQAGVLLYLPVFRNGEPTETVAQRHAALQGWVYSPFRMNDLVEGALGRFSSRIRLRIHDVAANGQGELLYDSHPQLGSEQLSRYSSTLRADQRLDIDGRTWLLDFEALPDFWLGRQERLEPFFVVVLVGLLLVSVTWFLATTRLRAHQLVRLSESLRRSEEQYSTLLNLSREGIAATDQDFHITFANPRLGELLGYEARRLKGQPLEKFWQKLDAGQRSAMLARLRHGFGERYEAELVRSDGKRIVALVSDGPLTDGHGAFLGTIFTVSDITERKEAERRIHFLATHDALTGIPNRLALRDAVDEAISRSRRYGLRFAVMFVDLDRFKEINDRYGHQVGDAVLMESARRMQSCLRASDMLGRLGGDEFMVLLPKILHAEEPSVVAGKMHEALDRPIRVEGHHLRVSASIGIALYPEHGEDMDTLVRHADEAMYGAKTNRRSR